MHVNRQRHIFFFRKVKDASGIPARSGRFLSRPPLPIFHFFYNGIQFLMFVCLHYTTANSLAACYNSNWRKRKRELVSRLCFAGLFSCWFDDAAGVFIHYKFKKIYPLEFSLFYLFFFLSSFDVGRPFFLFLPPQPGQYLDSPQLKTKKKNRKWLGG